MYEKTFRKDLYEFGNSLLEEIMSPINKEVKTYIAHMYPATKVPPGPDISLRQRKAMEDGFDDYFRRYIDKLESTMRIEERMNDFNMDWIDKKYFLAAVSGRLKTISEENSGISYPETEGTYLRNTLNNIILEFSRKINRRSLELSQTMDEPPIKKKKEAVVRNTIVWRGNENQLDNFIDQLVAKNWLFKLGKISDPKIVFKRLFLHSPSRKRLVSKPVQGKVRYSSGEDIAIIFRALADDEWILYDKSKHSFSAIAEALASVSKISKSRIANVMSDRNNNYLTIDPLENVRPEIESRGNDTPFSGLLENLNKV